MTDPLRTDRHPEAGEVPERERDARIERLLVAGLDHYFAGQHELAISVWTRVLFLDRGHARAKAYIDRARGAVAERLREGDELLHTGAAAFDRGDADAARDLLESAVERGASTEEALALLERLNRLEHATVRPVRAISARQVLDVPGEATLPVAEPSGSTRIIWVATGVLTGMALAGVVAWIALNRPEWLPLGSAAVVPPIAQVDEPLPVPASSEVWLSRARTLYEDGRLRDALAALEAVGQSDPRRADADELRAAIQRTLLDAARVSLPPAAPPPTGGAQSRVKPPTHPS